MKPVFRCDYCSKLGTEEEIKEHEPICIENYDRKSCYTCVHKNLKMEDGKWCYICKAGMDVPVGKLIEFCPSYERLQRLTNNFADLFGDLFVR